MIFSKVFSVSIILLIGFVTAVDHISAIETEYREYKSSLKQDTFGTCNLEVVSSDSVNLNTFLRSHIFDDNAISVVLLQPTESAKSDLNSVPTSYTKSTKNFGSGKINGTSVVDKFLMFKAWHVPQSHPINANKQECVQYANESGQKPVRIYDNLIRNTVDYYLIRVSKALVYPSGIIGAQCGYYQASEGCETMFKFVGRKWMGGCKKQLIQRGQSWSNMWNTNRTDNTGSNATYFFSGGGINISESIIPPLCNGNTNSRPVQHVHRVVVIATAWDENYVHFLMDSVTRLIPIIEWLKSNPDVRIHIRGYVVEGRGPVLRNRILTLLGLDPSRYISGTIQADVAYFPRAMKCSNPVSFSHQVRALSKYLKEQAQLKLATDPILPPLGHHQNKLLTKRIMIQQRNNTNTSEPDSWREWNDTKTSLFVSAFSTAFPQHHVVKLSSSDTAWTDCLSCQIREYQRTDILVGLHGAGSLMVEIVGRYEGRMLPLCGYFGPLAAIFGVHHFIYYHDAAAGEELDSNLVAVEAHKFYEEMKLIGR